MRYYLSYFMLFLVTSGVSLATAGDIDLDRLRSIPNVTVLEDGILGGGYPTVDALVELKRQGFKAVIDLRTIMEGTLKHRKQTEQVGLLYFNIPIRSSVDTKQVQELSEILENPDNFPVLIHCSIGGRVQMLWDEYEKTVTKAQ